VGAAGESSPSLDQLDCYTTLHLLPTTRE